MQNASTTISFWQLSSHAIVCHFLVNGIDKRLAKGEKGEGVNNHGYTLFVFLLTAKLIPNTFCINMSDNIISGRLLWKTLFIFVFLKFSFSFFIYHIINSADHALHVKLNFLCEHILDFIFERSSNYFCYFFICRKTCKYGFRNAIWIYSLQNSTRYYST